MTSNLRPTMLLYAIPVYLTVRRSHTGKVTARNIKMRRCWLAIGALILGTVGNVSSQECPKSNPLEQKAQEQKCLSEGGEWAKLGMRGHFCNIYTCAQRTKDGGKECRALSDCEGSCLYDGGAPSGTRAIGRCAHTNKRGFECSTRQVHEGKVIDAACVD
jgi:hypothetical protein